MLVIYVYVTYLALDTAIPMLRWVTEDPSTEVTCMFWRCPGTRLVMWHRLQSKNPQFVALKWLLSPPHIKLIVVSNYTKYVSFLTNYVYFSADEFYIFVYQATSPCYCYQMQLEMQCVAVIYITKNSLNK